ncbi:MAG TPA: methylmalonyl Co-A mutase-associated GTPase MeaB [Candidatus Acidoferrales bacterium]|nr:methylmalonyl Co-A mutase-associated GTPase MeaB [Candidatus Acidoferrales bacterium]
MNASAENWVEKIRAGDVRAVSRALTAIENGEADARGVLRELFPLTGKAWRIGVTGGAGTGKSTLVSCLAAHYRAQGKTVGVIAVDPSSPFTGGAILGDRIRMQSHATDDGVFIRSMAARGAWGGLAQAAADAALLLDAAGKDIVILETVGVGQDEIEVARVADCTLVVLVPGSGDEVQNLKAGLMEIADIFVVNKADYEEAGKFEERLVSIVQLAPPRDRWSPKIVRTVATEEKGIVELARDIQAFREVHGDPNVRRAHDKEYWKNWLIRAIQQRATEEIAAGNFEGRTLNDMAAAVASRKKDPYAAADELYSTLRRQAARSGSIKENS